MATIKCDACGGDTAAENTQCEHCCYPTPAPEARDEPPAPFAGATVTPTEDPKSGLKRATPGVVTVGFVLAFIIPIIGTILCVTGRNEADRQGAGESLANAGFIVSIVIMSLCGIISCGIFGIFGILGVFLV